MAELSVSGRMSVKTLRKQFKEAYGSTLRVYHGSRFADEDATLASIRKSDAKGGDLKVNGNLKVGNFEERFLETFGIKVQVSSVDDSSLVNNDLSLSASGR
jgi:hypothetical protein